MAIKGMPTNPPGMRRRQKTHRPSQSYEIDLQVDGAWKLVGYSQHAETAKRAVYWTFTSVQEATWTQPNDRHYFGMARPEKFGDPFLPNTFTLPGQLAACNSFPRTLSAGYSRTWNGAARCCTRRPIPW